MYTKYLAINGIGFLYDISEFVNIKLFRLINFIKTIGWFRGHMVA